MSCTQFWNAEYSVHEATGSYNLMISLRVGTSADKGKATYVKVLGHHPLTDFPLSPLLVVTGIQHDISLEARENKLFCAINTTVNLSSLGHLGGSLV